HVWAPPRSGGQQRVAAPDVRVASTAEVHGNASRCGHMVRGLPESLQGSHRYRGVAKFEEVAPAQGSGRERSGDHGATPPEGERAAPEETDPRRGGGRGQLARDHATRGWETPKAGPGLTGDAH